MSTPNFHSMKYDMPLICGRSVYQIAEAYAEEYGEEISDDGLYWQQIDDAEEAEILAEEFTSNLIFHDVKVISGYYDGFQFYVSEKFENQFDLDKDSRYCIDNDDAHYYFDMCRSRAIRAADAEKRKIAKWLRNLRNDGYNEVACTAIFSNGEAIYEIVS